LIAIAGAIPARRPQWRDYLNNEGGAGVDRSRLARTKLGADLSIRAQPAAIVNG
jgi:hypothetical protein